MAVFVGGDYDLYRLVAAVAVSFPSAPAVDVVIGYRHFAAGQPP
jgi:hypothetical protein